VQSSTAESRANAIPYAIALPRFAPLPARRQPVYLSFSQPDEALEGETMNTAIKTMMLGIAACAFAAPASAYTLRGTVPADGHKAVIDLQKPIPTTYSYVKLTLTLPQVLSAGIHYGAEFCVGPAGNPCPLPIIVPGGQQIIVIFHLPIPNYTLTVSQATVAAVPYTLKVDYLVH
jgi:hypothetical protein